MLFHLLIVDDEPTIRKGLTHFIAWDSINCIVDDTASDGAEAIEKIKQIEPDIVITDIKMPISDGIDVSKFIYENYPSIKIIILTGYADFEYARCAVKYQVTDFILKPTSKEKLTEAVKSAQDKIIEERSKNSIQEEDISFLQERLLLELTNGSKYYESIIARIHTYGITLDYYFLIAFQIIRTKQQKSEQNLIYVKDIIKMQNESFYCYRYNSNLVFALFPVEHFIEVIPNHIIHICDEIVTISKTLYSIDLSIGISLCQHNFQSLKDASYQAISALSMSFYNSEKISVYSNSFSEHKLELSSEYTLCLYEIETLLQNGDFKNLKLIINQLFTQFHINLMKSEDVKNICIFIYYICSRTLIKNAVSLSPIMLANINDCTTIFELEQIIHQLIEQVETVMKKEKRKLSPIVEQAIDYIHTYLHKEISLEIIADHIHVNPSHLSRTFKKDCKQSITEYINQVKIEKAQELLTCSQLMTYEIAEKVGFHDPTYFSSTFKKYTGVSPKEYKLLHFNK